jgi:hypothetical protein
MSEDAWEANIYRWQQQRFSGQDLQGLELLETCTTIQ